eukprot:ANDGO_05781.mRNA.1 putative E3 ubiquitin-protein ligase HUL4
MASTESHQISIAEALYAQVYPAETAHEAARLLFLGSPIVFSLVDNEAPVFRPGTDPLRPDIFQTLLQLSSALQSFALLEHCVERTFVIPSLLGGSFSKFRSLVSHRMPFYYPGPTTQSGKQVTDVIPFPVAEVVVHDPESSGISWDAVELFYSEMNRLHLLKPSVLEHAANVLLIAMNTNSSNLQENSIRCILILLCSPIAMHPQFHRTFLFPLLQILGDKVYSSSRLRECLVLWSPAFGRQRFSRFVDIVQQFLTVRWLLHGFTDEAVHCSVRALAVLERCNTIGSALAQASGILPAFPSAVADESSNPHGTHGTFLPVSAFYNDAVNRMDFEGLFIQYSRWLSTLSKKSGPAPVETLIQSQFSVCEYPFVLDPAIKSKIIQIESAKMQRDFAQEAFVRQALFAEATFPVFVLHVNRSKLVQSTLSELATASQSDFKKPLKVKFAGEEGVDEGGVRKEFFQIIVREVFDPAFGMFEYSEQQRSFWFSRTSVGGLDEFQFVGIILGLALYNSIILDVHFPQVLYKKLLSETPVLSDLVGLDPVLYHSLVQMLEYEGDDFESIFMNDFSVLEDYYGEKRTVELKPNGTQVQVSKDNREEYVNLLVRYLLVDSVAQQFNAFRQGFLAVAGGYGLQLLRAEELEMLLCGSPDLDFKALEQNTRYEDGYSAESRIIREFWEIVHQWSQADKKRLLFFVTGSDRVPIKGLGNLLFIISRNGPDSDRLPTSHTCFNHLLLPEYSSREKLESMLLTAIKNSEGFGLM